MNINLSCDSHCHKNGTSEHHVQTVWESILSDVVDCMKECLCKKLKIVDQEAKKAEQEIKIILIEGVGSNSTFINLVIPFNSVSLACKIDRHPLKWI